MSGIMSMLLGARTAIAAAVDEFFNRVTLLLPGDGTNGAQNNTFLDSSTNNFTITRNGNATQGTFSPFSQTGWGNYLDGTGDYLTVADNAVLDMGSSSFTMEFWTYLTGTVSTYQAYISKRSGTGVYGGVSLYLTSSRTLNLQATLNGSSWGVDITTTSTVSQNEWVHIAVVRNGNVWTVYINGTSGATTTVSGTVPDNSSAFTIGAGAADGGHTMVACYISNFRLVKGTALYTANFTPSTSPLTKTSQGATASEVELLTCQDNRFLDNSDNAFTITVNGNPSVQPFSPFAPTAAYSAATVGGSGYFDGTGDSLSVADNSAFDLSGSTSWCIETWAYYNTLSGEQNILEKFTAPSGPGWTLYKFAPSNNSGTLDIYGGTSSFNSAHTPVAGQWIHIVCCRDNPSGRTSWFINGSRTATTTSFSIASNASTPLLVGARVGGSNNHNGYLCGTRVIKGSSEYDPSQTTITVPNSPPTNITNTSLLLNYTNAGITDATAKNDLETLGNAQISTTQSKFGGSSVYFDGTGDYLFGRSTPDLSFGTGDFTVEGWFYAGALGGQPALLNNGSDAGGLVITFLSAKIYAYFVGAGNVFGSGGATLVTNTWYHFAWVRSGSTHTFYINGTAYGSTYSSAGNHSSTGGVGIGYSVAGTAFAAFNGYIDDLRITKGYARYTANFTAPTAAFPLQ